MPRAPSARGIFSRILKARKRNEIILFRNIFGLDEEWCYYLAELEAARGPLNLGVKRDLNFTPARFGKVREADRVQSGRQGRAPTFFVSLFRAVL
jgi:hypothetical protein